ncbi:hypothetical protein ACHAPJ_013621 [Fusarium lateritium]
MRSTNSFPVALLALTQMASAHYFFPHLFINDVKSAEYDNDMRCNTGAQANAGSTKVAKVNAGDTIGFGLDLDGPIIHPGPVQVYMSQAPNNDVASYDGSGDWSKVFELGATFPMVQSGENWISFNKNRIDFSIPSEVTSGQYLVRIEHLALHRPSGTEFYFNCAHVEVQNSGNGQKPTDVVRIPGVYDSKTEGLSPNYSICNGATSYPMPGPAVFGRSNSGSAASAAP